MNDHDLIIKIHTIVERLVVDFKDIKDNTVTRIENLELHKANKIDLALEIEKIEKKVAKTDQDFEDRMKKQEISTTKIITWGSAGLLVLGVVEFLVAKFVSF